MDQLNLRSINSKWDVYLGCCFIALGLLILYFFFKGNLSQYFGGKFNHHTFGQVSHEKPGVRYRLEDLPYWVDIEEQKRMVYEGGAIFTDTESTADLKLDSGEIIEIQPGSLVVLEPASSQDHLGIFGKIFQKLGLTQKKIALHVKTGSVKLKNKSPLSEVVLKKDGSEISLNTLKEEQLVASIPNVERSPASVSNNIVPPKLAILEAESIRDTIVSDLRLKNSLSADIGQNFINLKIHWSSNGGQDKNQIKVYSGNKLIQQAESNGSDFQIRLNADQIAKLNYSVNGKNAKVYFDLVPPKIKTLDLKRYESEDLGNLMFAWTETGVTQNYEYQISPKRDFSEENIERITKDNFASIGVKEGDTYYVRVRSQTAQGPSPWSEIKQVKLK